MIRRLAAILGIALLFLVLISLIWTMHVHRERTIDAPVESANERAGSPDSSMKEF